MSTLLRRDIKGAAQEAPLGAGDLRVMLGMIYATNPRIAAGMELVRRVKDTAFCGIRALSD